MSDLNSRRILIWTVINLAICLPLSGFPVFFGGILIESLKGKFDVGSIMLAISAIGLLSGIVLSLGFFKVIQRPTYSHKYLQLHFGLLTFVEFGLVNTSALFLALGPVGWLTANTMQTVSYFILADIFAAAVVIGLSAALYFHVKKFSGLRGSLTSASTRP